MGNRIFISINLPEDIKKRLASYQDKWPELPARWTKPENIHITLIFIGYANDEELVEVCRIVKEAASRHSGFSVRINKVCYGPPKKMPPRMVWAVGERSSEFASLKEGLEKSLAGSGRIRFSPEKRESHIHITLARIRQMEWRRIEPEERPEIEEGIDLSFPVNSIEIMESKLKRGGAEYTILESVPLSSEIQMTKSK